MTDRQCEVCFQKPATIVGFHDNWSKPKQWCADCDEPATCNDPDREDVTKLEAKNLLHIMEKAELKRELEQASEQLVFLNGQVEALRKVVDAAEEAVEMWRSYDIPPFWYLVDAVDEWRATQ